MAASTTQAPGRGWHRRLNPNYCAFAHRACNCKPLCPTGGIEVRPSADGPVVHACTCPVCTAAVA